MTARTGTFKIFVLPPRPNTPYGSWYALCISASLDVVRYVLHCFDNWTYIDSQTPIKQPPSEKWKVPLNRTWTAVLWIFSRYGLLPLWTKNQLKTITLWGTLPDCFMAQFTVFFSLNVTSRIHWYPQNRISDAIPQHWELHTRLFTNKVWVL